MSEDWSDVTEAVEACAKGYTDLLAAREDERAGTKALARVEDRWLELLDIRAAALVNHWREEDGMLGEFKRVGPTLQRYYAHLWEQQKEAKKK